MCFGFGACAISDADATATAANRSALGVVFMGRSINVGPPSVVLFAQEFIMRAIVVAFATAVSVAIVIPAMAPHQSTPSAQAAAGQAGQAGRAGGAGQPGQPGG